MKWNRKTVYVEYQNRYIDAIIQEDKVVIDCTSLSDCLIERLIDEHNISVSEDYKRGLKDGVAIRNEVFNTKTN